MGAEQWGAGLYVPHCLSLAHTQGLCTGADCVLADCGCVLGVPETVGVGVCWGVLMSVVGVPLEPWVYWGVPDWVLLGCLWDCECRYVRLSLTVCCGFFKTGCVLGLSLRCGYVLGVSGTVGVGMS